MPLRPRASGRRSGSQRPARRPAGHVSSRCVSRGALRRGVVTRLPRQFVSRLPSAPNCSRQARMKTRDVQESTYCLSAFAAGGAMLAAVPSAAQPTRPEEVVVTSSMIAQPRRQIGTAMSVIDFDDIELRGYTDPADALRTQAGIGVSNSGGPGKRTRCTSAARRASALCSSSTASRRWIRARRKSRRASTACSRRATLNASRCCAGRRGSSTAQTPAASSTSSRSAAPTSSAAKSASSTATIGAEGGRGTLGRQRQRRLLPVRRRL